MIDPKLPEIEVEALRIHGEWLACQMMCQLLIRTNMTLNSLTYRMRIEELIYNRRDLERQIAALQPYLRRN